jgi:phosphate starvation-inducible protein PhoH and related proteins
MTMTKKHRREVGEPKAPIYSLKSVRPITISQNRIFKEWSKGQHLLLHGFAGTGKSYLAAYLGLREIEKDNAIEKMVIVRSAVPSRKQGFLPGNEEEKAAVYEMPYRTIVDELHGKAGAYNRLKETKAIEFETTSYLRGLTISNSVVVVDEVQNLDDGEMNTVMTRMGENSRVILCGDTAQNDLKRTRTEVSCIGSLLETVDQMPSFSIVELGINDIVRSGLVKEWILARS